MKEIEPQRDEESARRSHSSYVPEPEARSFCLRACMLPHHMEFQLTPFPKHHNKFQMDKADIVLNVKNIGEHFIILGWKRLS